jgi:ATP-dependent DNA helicase RecG
LTKQVAFESMIEHLCTGIRDMIRHCREAGLPEPEFAVNDGFVTTLRRQTEKAETTQPESRAETGVESKMVIVILDHLQGGVLGKQDLAERLGKARPTGYLNDLVRKMVSSGLIEFTIPEKPNSRMQKYRIADEVTIGFAGQDGMLERITNKIIGKKITRIFFP